MSEVEERARAGRAHVDGGGGAAEAPARAGGERSGVELLELYVSEDIEFDEDEDEDDAADRVDADTVRRLALLIKHFYTFVHGKFKLPMYVNMMQRLAQLVISLIAWLCIISMDYSLDKRRTLEILFQYLVVIANPSELVLSAVDFPAEELFRNPQNFVELVDLQLNIERFWCEHID